METAPTKALYLQHSAIIAMLVPVTVVGAPSSAKPYKQTSSAPAATAALITKT